MYGNRCKSSGLLFVLESRHQISRVSKWSSGANPARQTSTSRQDFGDDRGLTERCCGSRLGPADRRIRLCGPDFSTVAAAVVQKMSAFADQHDAGRGTERAGEM